MRPSRLVTIAAAIAAATLTLGSAPTGAQEPDVVPITVDPASGPPGSLITVSGTDCVPGAPLEVGLIDPELGYGVVEDFDQVGDDAGDWTATLEVPEDATPGTVYTVDALCIGEGAPTYEDGEFVVTDPLDPGPAVLPLTVDPTSGPVGTRVSVSGGGCPGGAVTFLLLAGTSLDDATHIVTWWFAIADEEGNWAEVLTVPSTMAELDSAQVPPDLVPVIPGDDYFVIAGCNPEGRVGIFTAEPGSEPVPFDITGGGDAPGTEPPPSELVVSLGVGQAQPATPVVADPTYTG